jgi:hypothetical protein
MDAATILVIDPHDLAAGNDAQQRWHVARQ